MKFKIVLILFLFGIFNVNSSEYPETLTENSIISIVNLDYTTINKSLFSKSCLRIFDKNSSFDELIDFSYFENFDDSLFLPKFYFSNKKAKVLSTTFSKALAKEKDVKISEMILDLSYDEKLYIFNFLKIFIGSFSDYSYDYDITSNNSYTYISSILNDCYRSNKDLTTEHSFVKSFREFTPVNINKQKSIPIHAYNYKIENINQKSFKTQLPKVSILTIVLLSIGIAFITIYTVYQTLVLYFPNYYRSSLLKLFHFFDFSILFISGFIGLIIVLQNYFSNQQIFRNNFEFLFLCPLNIVFAFDIYFALLNDKFKKYYFISAASLALIYFPLYLIIQREFPLIRLLISIPVIVRLAYFAFLYITKKADSVSQISLLNETI